MQLRQKEKRKKPCSSRPNPATSEVNKSRIKITYPSLFCSEWWTFERYFLHCIYSLVWAFDEEAIRNLALISSGSQMPEQVWLNGSFRQGFVHNFFMDQCKERNVLGEDRNFFKVGRWWRSDPLNSKLSRNVLWKHLAKTLVPSPLPASIACVNIYLRFAFSSKDCAGELRKVPLYPPVREELQV